MWYIISSLVSWQLIWNYFDNRGKYTNMGLKCENLMLFSVIHDGKLNIWTVDWAEWDIWTCQWDLTDCDDDFSQFSDISG